MRTRAPALFGLLCCAAAHAATLKVENEPVVLGRNEAVKMQLEVDEPPGTEDRPLVVRSNVGSFGPVTRVGRGHYEVVFSPPPTRFPQVALIAVWRETGPDAAIDFFRVALSGVTRLPVKAKPGSKVRVTVGTESTEPAVVPRKGELLVTLVVPPGVENAQVIAELPTGVVTQRSLAIPEQHYNRLTAALVPHALLADGRSWARLEVFYDLGGIDMPASRIVVTPSAGAVSLVSSERGRFIYRYVAPTGLPQTEVQFSVTVQGDAGSTAAAALSLTQPAPARVVVRPPKEMLVANGESEGKVELLVLDAEGLGSIGQPLELTANTEALEVVERGDGLYDATYRAPRRFPPGGQVDLVARIRGTRISGGAGFQVRVAPVPFSMTSSVNPGAAPADGSTEVEVLIELKDEAGQALGGASLSLTADLGTIGPPSDQGGGRYRATYVAARASEGQATITVRDATGAFESPVTVPLREAARFELGLQAGIAHSLRDQFGPLAKLVFWRRFQLARLNFGFGLSAGYGYASTSITTGALASRSRADFVPMSVRLGWEAVLLGRFSLVVGAGADLAYARMSTSLTGVTSNAWGGGGDVFLVAGLRLGPGRALLEVGYAYLPVRSASFTLQAGGLAFGLGYRFLL